MDSRHFGKVCYKSAFLGDHAGLDSRITSNVYFY
jgi:hypothetical protein